MEESSRVFFPRILLLASVLAQPVLAQGEGGIVALSVDDLVAPWNRYEPYLSKVPQVGGRVIVGEENWLKRGDESDLYTNRREQLCGDGESSGWFDSGTLAAVLVDLAPELGNKLSFDATGSVLRVPGGLAVRTKALLNELRACMPPELQTEVELVRGGTTVLGRTVLLRSGRRQWVSVVEQGLAVRDFEVEIAQESFTANPLSVGCDTGAIVVLKPTVAAAAPNAWFEVLVRVVDAGQEIAPDLKQTSCGPIDRAHQKVHELAAVLPVRLGVPAVTRWTGPDGELFELRVTSTWQVPAPTPISGREVQYDTCGPTVRGFRCTRALWPNPAFDDPTYELRDYVDQLERIGSPGRAAGPMESARLGVDTEATALRLAANTRQQQLVPVGLRLQLLDAPVGAKPDGEGQVADSRELARAELSTVQDVWACLTAHEELTVVLDWDCEVAQAARIGDPKPSRLASGLFLDLKCSDSQVEIVGELSTRISLGTRETRLSLATSRKGPVAKGSTSDGEIELPGEVVPIDLPKVQVQPITANLPLRRGEASAWRARSSALPQGRELLMLVRRTD